MTIAVDLGRKATKQTKKVHRSHDVEGTEQHVKVNKVNVKGQTIHFLVNASPFKLLDAATSNFAGA